MPAKWVRGNHAMVMPPSCFQHCYGREGLPKCPSKSNAFAEGAVRLELAGDQSHRAKGG